MLHPASSPATAAALSASVHARRPAASASGPWRALLELLFPPRCVGCSVRGTLLCEPCRELMPPLPAEVCRRCGMTRPLLAPKACRACPRLAEPLELVRAAYIYEGTARKAVHVLKFRAGPQMAPVLGGLMREGLRRRPLRAEVVVPVPLAAGRERKRGYNQAALLARHVAPGLGAELATRVLEREDRPAQVNLGAAYRLDNLRGSIRCVAPGQVRDRRVVVLDDVMTTGATLSACAEALAEAGAAQVMGVVFARTL